MSDVSITVRRSRPAVSAAPSAATGSRVKGKLDITQLYRQYGDMVLGRCRTLLGNDADAQEVTQDVFLKLHRKQHLYRGEASPSTFLYKVTTTTCLNRLRSRRRRPEDPVEEMPVPRGQPLRTDALLENVEVRHLIDHLMAEEDDRTRACLTYHYIDGMTHDETGEMLGISGAAVRKRIA
jgi:RNA polymerase sigma-70 factor (ECF subfamily)